MELNLSKEDIKRIRIITRQEIGRFLSDIFSNFIEKNKGDDTYEYEKEN
ncbi:MAG TPA: hypothetical protein VGB37_12735 [Candidatus Lokiarchaeia archaeon]